VSRMGRNAAPAIYVVTQKSWGRYAPHRDTRPLLQGRRSARDKASVLLQQPLARKATQRSWRVKTSPQACAVRVGAALCREWAATRPQQTM